MTMLGSVAATLLAALQLQFVAPDPNAELARTTAIARNVLVSKRCVEAFEKYTKGSAAEVASRGVFLWVQWPSMDTDWAGRSVCPNRITLQGNYMMTIGGKLMSKVLVHEMAHLAACDQGWSLDKSERAAQQTTEACFAEDE